MNISLIGMPCSGKTTISQELKNILNGYYFIDTDNIIVEKEHKTINEIFAQNGETYFRNLETKVLKDILSKDNQIISTGGGIIIRNENINLLKEKSFVIYLKTNINTLIERAKQNNERPLLNDNNISQKLKKLLSERENQYNKAHITIITDNKSINETAQEIMEKINENSRS